MTDVFPRKQRSEIMARVKGKDTKPERLVRSMLHRNGFRFRLHRSDLPGKPDIVLPGRRVVIFVHGCFWHQHKGCKAAQRPASNPAYWGAKLDNNRRRDARNRRALSKLGWKVIVVWECSLKYPNRVESRLTRTLKNM